MVGGQHWCQAGRQQIETSEGSHVWGFFFFSILYVALLKMRSSEVKKGKQAPEIWVLAWDLGDLNSASCLTTGFLRDPGQVPLSLLVPRV